MKSAQEILTSQKKFCINLGLERIKKILDLLGSPQNKFKIIHVAGTNGKGSTCKIINQILVEENKKVGLFTSPHLYSYCERIKVNNEDVSRYVLDRLTNDIDNLAQENSIELTEFELLTAVAFYYFYAKNVEYVVLEVGLGGLYDATNVVENPMVEVITSIDFDHTQQLGNSIDEIAAQKAGIIKNNSFVVINKDNLGYNVISKIAKTRKTKVIEAKDVEAVFKDGINYAKFDNKEVEFNLLGKHQTKNLALALSTVECLDFVPNEDSIIKALKNVTWAARLEYKKEENLLIDGAHNPSGITTLVDFLNENYKDDKKTIIFGCLERKDYNLMIEKLFELNNAEFYFNEFNYPDSLKLDKLDEKFREKFKLINSDEIKNIIKENKNLKVVCGSLYMIGEVFK